MSYLSIHDYLGNLVCNDDEVYDGEGKVVDLPTKLSWQKGAVNTGDPKVWGPAFWFSLHVSAAHYPLEASPIVKERMKGRILAIHYEIPCATCRPHAVAYIEKNRDNLDKIVSGRHALGKFYVDFHNQVNKRYNKPEWTYEQAYKVYSGNAEVTFLK